MSPSTSLEAFWTAHAEWSTATFGTPTERGPVGPLKHLAKEVEEAIATPDDLMEYADLFLLTCDATRRAGFTCEQLMDAAWAKLAICRARKWPKTAATEAVEHVREDSA